MTPETEDTITVSMDVVMWAVGPETNNGRVLLSYTPHHPYETRADITADGQDTTTWLFARDLLRQAVHYGMGGEAESDVRCALSGDWVVVRLRSPFGKVHMRLPKTAVCRYLALSYQKVPSGAEIHHHGDTEAELRRILSGGVS